MPSADTLNMGANMALLMPVRLGLREETKLSEVREFVAQASRV